LSWGRLSTDKVPAVSEYSIGKREKKENIEEKGRDKR
jgi:hypothetical protein